MSDLQKRRDERRCPAIFSSRRTGLFAALLCAALVPASVGCGARQTAEDQRAADTSPSDAPSETASDAAVPDDAAPTQDAAPKDTAGSDANGDADDNPKIHCAPYEKSSLTGVLKDDRIDESSGLAASRRHPGLLWTHNDSGDEARLFLIRRDGELVAEVLFEGVEAIDWEDIAVAPCEPGSPASCVYVADTGDNLARRDVVVIHRVPEPDLPAGHQKPLEEEQTSIVLTLTDIHQTWFQYPEGPRDAEALMVHPQTSEMYVVEKNRTSDAPVFQVPRATTTRDTPAEATQVGSLHLSGLTGLVAMITAGDIAPDGREFTIRTYVEAFTYCAPPEADADAPVDFATLLQAEPTRYFMPLMGQAESLGYDLDGPAMWVGSEGKRAPIYRVTRPEPAAEQPKHGAWHHASG